MKRKPKSRQNDARVDELTREQVVAHLATLSQPASIREIAHAMGLKHRGRRFLPRVIEELKGRDEIEEVHGGHYRLAGQRNAKTVSSKRSGAAPGPAAYSGASPQRARDPDLVSGRIVAHRDGYGFLVPDKPMPKVEGDLFIGRDNLNDAMHGDRVLARLRRMRDGLVTVIDTRPAEEFAAGHLRGALNVPLHELKRRLGELPRDQAIVAYCRGAYCVLSYEAVAELRKRGFEAFRLEEGYPEWKAAGLPVEHSATA